MKVLCTKVPSPVDGVELGSSPWVTVGCEYTVFEVVAGVCCRFGFRVSSASYSFHPLDTRLSRARDAGPAGVPLQGCL
jgi:hypothetical protein